MNKSRRRGGHNTAPQFIMELRPYQAAFVDAAVRSWTEYNRILGVAATGSGKTICLAAITEKVIAEGPVLFIADAQELVYQGADKFTQFGLFPPAVEMADSKASVGDSIVIGTTQSMARRLDKWPKDYFAHVMVDEAHRNTLGDMAQRVLEHFSPAKLLGVTATPFRSDKKQLGNFYESICYEIALPDLIKQGFLSRITIKSIPMQIDLRGVRTTAGDYNDADLGTALAPHLEACAKALIENAPNRKTVVFLPLIETSKKFVEILCSMGVKAVHVDGKDRDALHGDWQVICNASLLTTGWDEPSVDCVYILRPTKSLVLYMQMVGRGTRIFPGKENLLLLDPLYLSDRHDLVRPAKLIAKTEEELESVQKVLDDAQAGGGDGEQLDLLAASSEAAEARHRTLMDKLNEASKRKSRTVDAVEFALAINDEKLANYEPEVGWEMQPASVKQIASLEKSGFDTSTITCKGQASMLMDALFRRRDMGLATPKQVKWLIRFKHPSPWTVTFYEASTYLDTRFGKKTA